LNHILHPDPGLHRGGNNLRRPGFQEVYLPFHLGETTHRGCLHSGGKDETQQQKNDQTAYLTTGHKSSAPGA